MNEVCEWVKRWSAEDEMVVVTGGWGDDGEGRLMWWLCRMKYEEVWELERKGEVEEFKEGEGGERDSGGGSEGDGRGGGDGRGCGVVF